MAIPNLSATAETFMATVILIRGGRVMKKFFYFAAFAACVLTSCQQVEKDIKTPEENESQDKKETPGLVFTATTESSATKTALEENSGNYNVAWRSGDEITIIDAAATPNVGVYSTSSNTTSADFTFASGAEASTAPFKAWYPASIYNNGAPTLPATQEYVEGNIAGSPMFASSSTTSLKFKNLAGIICLNLSTGMADISVASIALSATQPMSGPISNAESLSSETPVAATVSGSAGITLDCGTGVAINGTPKPFYFAVPAGSYTGLSITVTATTGAYQTFTLKADKTIVVERSQITDINLTANNILYDLPAYYSPAEYLASTGTQYIDTGVPCDWQDFVDIDFMYTGREPGNVHPSEGGSVFGAHGWSKANGIYEKCIYWRGFGKIAYNFALDTQYNVKTVDGTHSSINGVTYQIDVTGSVDVAPCNFALFANYSDYNNQGWTYFSIARIYFCKIYDRNHMWLRYFVPCVRTSDGKPGMFDRVTGAFYVNNGTGEFNTNLTPTVTSYDLTAGDVTVPAGETATVTGSNANSVLTIGTGATVTLEDATLKQIVTEGDATLILSGTNTQTTEFTGAAIQIADNATLTIDGTGSLNVDRKWSRDYGCIFGPNSNLVVNGGTMVLYSNKGAGNRVCMAVYLNNYTQNGGSVEAYGRYTNNDANSYVNGMEISNDVLITGGSLRTEGATALWVGNNISISGGTVTAIGTGAQYSGSTGIVPGGNKTGGKLTISGGTVRAEGNGGGDGQGPGIGRRTDACGDIIISGGDVTVSSTGNGFPGGAAAIGTGTDAVDIGCNITITSGITRLVVTKGVNAQAPIGKGNASSSVGTITIDGVVNPTAESFFENLNLEVSNGGNTWTLTPVSNTPASLANLKDMVNADKDVSGYIGRYVYSDGSIGTDETDAIGLVAYMNKTATQLTGINEACRILVLGISDISSGTDVGAAWDLCNAKGYAIAGVDWSNWRIPTTGQWNVICQSDGLGQGSFANLSGDDSKAKLNRALTYWTSSIHHNDANDYGWPWTINYSDPGNDANLAYVNWSWARSDYQRAARAVFGF